MTIFQPSVLFLPVRVNSIILLLCLIPSTIVGVAYPIELLCIANDHVSFNCHGDSHHCNTERCDSGGDSESSCVDVATRAIEGQVARAGLTIPPPLFCCLLTAESVELNLISSSNPIDSGDDPPGFSAREFCCCIALRC